MTRISSTAVSSPFAQQVKTDCDRDAKVQSQDSLWVDRIKEAVNIALTARGGRPCRPVVTSQLCRSRRLRINPLSKLFTMVLEAAVRSFFSGREEVKFDAPSTQRLHQGTSERLWASGRAERDPFELCNSMIPAGSSRISQVA